VTTPDPLFDALTRAALESTAGRDAWLLAADEHGYVHVAAASGDEAERMRGTRLSSSAGVEGFVLASGQPIALSGSTQDLRLREGLLATLEQAPDSVLCVACEQDEGPVGVLLVAGKQDGSSFTLEDIEIITVLANVAAVALSQRAGQAHPPGADELAAELTALAAADPSRYTRLAPFIMALVRHG
jgi:GAF domain-containing protein